MTAPAPPAVLQVCHGWPPERLGGVELYVEALHDGLLALGVDSNVFCAGDGPVLGERRLQVTGPAPAPRSYRATLVRPDVEASFREWLASKRPDVVHFHHLTHLSLGLPRVAAKAGAMPLMTLHDYWLPCARGQLVDRELRRCPGPTPERCAWCVAGQLALEPTSARLGGALGGLPETWRAGIREWLGRRRGAALHGVIQERFALVDAAVSRIRRFASPSQDLARRMAGLGYGTGRIDPVALPLVRDIALAPPPGRGPVRFLFAASLIPTKGAHIALEAFAGLPVGAATLHIAGPRPRLDLDPGYAARLLARAAAIPGVTVEGPFPPGEAQARFDRADVLLLPSLWEENSPLIVREATAAGLRVVASRRGGVAELDPDARLVEPEPTALRGAMAEELRSGRWRRAPLPWPDGRHHAAEVLHWYRRCLGSG